MSATQNKTMTARAARYLPAGADNDPRSMLLPRRASLGAAFVSLVVAPGKRWTLGGSESRRASNCSG
jgi:hypothetical protein